MHIPLRRVNDVLLVLIVAINSYVILAPFLPQLQYWWAANHSSQRQDLSKRLTQPAPTPAPEQKAIPNSLVVPSMLLDTPVLEGAMKDRYKVLDTGIWRLSTGSTPDKGSNTVLIGHRFTYTNPRGVFYYLDKVKVGDEIGVFWHNKKYVYTVTSTQQVPPTETSVQDATDKPRLTLFTCTPLWMPKDRLVVVAELKGTP
jgi:LPXTG-site transpeptidase (sortase) family protein